LALPGGVKGNDDPQNCWPLHFQKWVEQGCGTLQSCPKKNNKYYLPESNTAQYFELLKKYRASDRRLWNNIGLVEGKLRFVSLSFVSGLKIDKLSAQDYVTAHKCALDAVRKINEGTKEEFKKANGDETNMQGLVPHDNYNLFMSGYSSEQYVKGFQQGIAFCLPICVIVLLFATGNILVTLYATFTIASILAWVLGFFKFFMGYELGTIVSVAGSIVIGFSVDYCIHVAHMYTDSSANTARGRTHFALSKMGGTVVGGALTTLAAGVALLPCTINFFSMMSVILICTIVAAAYHALLFLPALTLLIGPDGKTGHIFCCKKKEE